MLNKPVLLMPPSVAERALEFWLDATVVDSLEGLRLAQPFGWLLSFGTGVIVPDDILRSATCLNIHAASPEFPGRDPHHFAVYYGATEYGATLHVMTSRVDRGPILDVELRAVPENATPSDLLRIGNTAGFALMQRLFREGIPRERSDVRWGPRTFTRRDFRALCRIDEHMNEMEIERRRRAVAMPGYENLYFAPHPAELLWRSANQYVHEL